MTDPRFRQRWSLRSWRRELVLGEFGLMELFAFGRTRYTPWRHVRDLRWVRGGQAVIETEAGRPIRLGRNIDDLKALVNGAKERLLADRARARMHRLDENLVREWLYRAHRGWPSRTARTAGLALILAGVGVLAAYTFTASPAGVGVVGLGVMLTGMLLLLDTARQTQDPRDVGANEYGLRCDAGGRSVEVAWGEMVAVRFLADHERARRPSRMVVETRRGTATCALPRFGWRRLTRVAERAVAFNTARFVSAEEPLLSDASLSPTRLTADDADRGLTQVERSVEP